MVSPEVRRRWIYDPGLGWFHAPAPGWDWEQDLNGAALKRLLIDRAEATELARAKRIRLRASTIAGAAKVIEIDRQRVIAWDRDPMLAGLPGGGIVDLRTGEIRDAKRDDFVSKRLGVRPDPNVDTKLWDDLLLTMTGGGKGGEAMWLQQWLAYSLTALTTCHFAPVLYGKGGSGKSTIVRFHSRLLGDYCVGVPSDALVGKRGSYDRHPEWKTRLDGARFAPGAEIAEGARIKDGIFKELTGADQITANKMRRGSRDFYSTAKVIMFGNSRPRIPGWDSGLRRRLVPIRCHSVPKPERDPNLPRKLWEQAPGVLSLLVESAASAWKHGGDGMVDEPPPVITERRKRWFDRSDPIGTALRYLYSFTGRDSDRVAAIDVRTAVEGYYASGAHGVPPSARAIGPVLRRNGARSGRTRAGRHWEGICPK